MIEPRTTVAPVTRAELVNKSPGEIITLFINRAGGTDFSPKQLDYVETILDAHEDGTPFVKVTVQPRRETGWTNGPVTVDVPVFDVGEFYKDFTISLHYRRLVWDMIKPAILIREVGGPPATPKNIRLKEVGMGRGDSPNLDVTYLADYDNVFFTGTLPIKINDAPNTMEALKKLNKILLNTNDLN